VLYKFVHSDYSLVIVVFLRFWDFHIIFLYFLFLSYFSNNRIILGGKDSNVLNS